MTTPSPPSCGDPGRLPVHDAELEPEHARARSATASLGVRRRTARSGGTRRRCRTARSPSTASASVGNAGTPRTSRSFGLTGTQLVALLRRGSGRRRTTAGTGRDEAPTTAIRRADRSSVGDPPRRRAAGPGRGPPRGRGTRRRARRRARCGLASRPRRSRRPDVRSAASRSYGWPSAAGGMLRPTTPARTTIVTTYGSASRTAWAGAPTDVAELAGRRGERIDCPSGRRRGEQQRGPERPERRPAAEDHRRQAR